MTLAEQMATFVVHASHGDLSAAARQQFKMCVLDALGCAIGALDSEPPRIIRRQITQLSDGGRRSLIE